MSNFASGVYFHEVRSLVVQQRESEQKTGLEVGATSDIAMTSHNHSLCFTQIFHNSGPTECLYGPFLP
jgi:hypothetical protein